MYKIAYNIFLNIKGNRKMEDNLNRKKFKWYYCDLILKDESRKRVLTFLATSANKALIYVKKIFFLSEKPSLEQEGLDELTKILVQTKKYKVTLVDISEECFDVFEQICVGDNENHSKDKISKLEKLGFIYKDENNKYLPTESIRSQWLLWCKENFTIEEFENH
jgi:hypothetical protein